MKPTDFKAKHGREKSWLQSPPAAWRAETIILASLGLVALSGVVIAIISGSGPSNLAADPLQGYVHSGHLGADLRTATALGRYFFEAEPTLLTNVSEAGPTQKSIVMPTNNVKG